MADPIRPFTEAELAEQQRQEDGKLRAMVYGSFVGLGVLGLALWALVRGCV